ncbi:hypothetical protein VNO77_22606 [Canavalia gladiata]|uniref:Uncharacterized protein n=1 Tax=Canavalia gladiata TaxID=3824 RepID=A0AAN9L329_CANGL
MIRMNRMDDMDNVITTSKIGRFSFNGALSITKAHKVNVCVEDKACRSGAQLCWIILDEERGSYDDGISVVVYGTYGDGVNLQQSLEL